MIYQKHDISEKELISFRKTLQLNDLVLDKKDNKVSIITEVFSNQIPQIDGTTYRDVYPIYITKALLPLLGFVYLNDNDNKNEVYYKYSEKTVYNTYIGICISNDIHIIIGLYGISQTSDVYFFPLRPIKYISDLQHILQGTFEFVFNESNIINIKKYVLEEMKNDEEKLKTLFSL